MLDEGVMQVTRIVLQGRARQPVLWFTEGSSCLKEML